MKQRTALYIACLLLTCWSWVHAQDKLEIKPLDLLWSGEGIEQRLRFGGNKGTHEVMVQAAYQIGPQGILLVGFDEDRPDGIPLYFLHQPATDPQQRWQGHPLCDSSRMMLPDYWAIRPIAAEMRHDSLLLLLELADEENIGLLAVWCTRDQTFMERFIPLSGLDRELNMRIAPQVQCTWQADGVALAFRDSVVHMGVAAPGSAFPGAWVYMKARPTALDFSIRPTGMRPLSFGQFRYTRVVDGLALLDDSNRPISAKQAAKAAKEIAQASGQAAFDLVRGQAGVSAFFLRDYDQDTYQPIWEQHWLGRWEAGKWIPAPPLR